MLRLLWLKDKTKQKNTRSWLKRQILRPLSWGFWFRSLDGACERICLTRFHVCLIRALCRTSACCIKALGSPRYGIDQGFSVFSDHTSYLDLPQRCWLSRSGPGPRNDHFAPSRVWCERSSLRMAKSEIISSDYFASAIPYHERMKCFFEWKVNNGVRTILEQTPLSLLQGKVEQDEGSRGI